MAAGIGVFLCLAWLAWLVRNAATRRRAENPIQEPGDQSAGRPPARPPGDRCFCPAVVICLPGNGRSPEDAVTARRVLLDGLARDADVSELASELAAVHRRQYLPRRGVPPPRRRRAGLVPASRADPLPLGGLRERFLPGGAFGGRETPRSSARCWSQQPSVAGPNRICWMRWPGGRPRICGSTPCSRRSPASAPPPAGRACRCARHARTWLSALATQRHKDQFRTQVKRSSEGRAADHNGSSHSPQGCGPFPPRGSCWRTARGLAAWRLWSQAASRYVSRAGYRAAPAT